MKSSGYRPEDILPDNESFLTVDGFEIRKGTVGAVVKNADILSSANATPQQKAEAEQIIKELSHSIAALGMHKHVTWNDPRIEAIMRDAVKIKQKT